MTTEKLIANTTQSDPVPFTKRVNAKTRSWYIDRVDCELRLLVDQNIATLNGQQVRRFVTNIMTNARRELEDAYNFGHPTLDLGITRGMVTAMLQQYEALGYPVNPAQPTYDVKLLREALLHLRPVREQEDVLEQRAFEERLKTVDIRWPD